MIWGVVFSVLVLGTISCNRDLATNLFDQVWVATEPIQCMGNPWEQAWLESHNWDYTDYPKEPTTIKLDPEEFKIIQNFYYRLGVTVFKAKTVQKYYAVCDACSCPEGHTLYLLVMAEDVQKMTELGYRKESP